MNFDYILRDGIVAQHRTSRNKAFTVLYNGQIIKGPYKDTDSRYGHVLRRSEKLQAWGAPFIVHPLGTTSLMYKGEKYSFIVYDDLSKAYHPVQFVEELDFVKEPESIDNPRYKFLVRQGLIKLNDYLKKTKSPPEWLNNTMPHLILSMIYLNILRTGDMTLANVMIDEQNQKVYVIDYEDNLGKLREDEFFYFNKRPNKDVVAYLTKYVIPYYPALANILLNNQVLLADRLPSTDDAIRFTTKNILDSHKSLQGQLLSRLK